MSGSNPTPSERIERVETMSRANMDEVAKLSTEVVVPLVARIAELEETIKDRLDANREQGREAGNKRDQLIRLLALPVWGTLIMGLVQIAIAWLARGGGHP